MQKISADLIITNIDQPLTNGVIIYDENTGEIDDILASREGQENVNIRKGILVPGYINAHCHLELSHLKNVIDSGTGLIPFIKGVVTLRDFPQEVIDEQIDLYDRQMLENGIVAVGDICNKPDTANVKARSKMRYYSFVEVFDFLQDSQAARIFEQHRDVFDKQPSTDHHRKSYVPHAPYSVSPSLFECINNSNHPGQSISIHNQELSAENQLFIDKGGDFLDFYDFFDIPLNNFSSIGRSSIYYTIHHLKPIFKTLMVHNTMTTKEEITATHLWNQQTYWVTCPNANLYIENRLPKYSDFIDCGAKMCIGTDSLSSNWQLCIFEELKTIKKYQSGIKDLDLIKWATLNGANALGYDDLGKLKKGTIPGINLIDVDVHDGIFNLSQARSSIKII